MYRVVYTRGYSKTEQPWANRGSYAGRSFAFSSSRVVMRVSSQAASRLPLTAQLFGQWHASSPVHPVQCGVSCAPCDLTDLVPSKPSLCPPSPRKCTCPTSNGAARAGFRKDPVQLCRAWQRQVLRPATWSRPLPLRGLSGACWSLACALRPGPPQSLHKAGCYCSLKFC